MGCSAGGHRYRGASKATLERRRKAALAASSSPPDSLTEGSTPPPPPKVRRSRKERPKIQGRGRFITHKRYTDGPGLPEEVISKVKPK